MPLSLKVCLDETLQKIRDVRKANEYILHYTRQPARSQTKYIDWMKEYEEAEKAGQTPPKPPAGLFDENGDLNIYGNLDLRDMGDDYSYPDKLRFPEGGGKLKGNGHRVKTNSDWSGLKDSLEDIWVSKNGENTRYD